MIKLILILLGMGVVFIGLALYQIAKIIRQTQFYRRQWHLNFGLILFFLWSYIGLFLYQLISTIAVINFFVAIVFFFGAAYVFLASSLFSKTMSKLFSVEELELQFNQLRYKSEHDSLTGCLSRDAIYQLIEIQIEQHRLDDGESMIMFIDLDGFKSINDTFGHSVGDETLKAFSLFLKNTLRNTDLIGRFGGDEFLVLMQNTSLNKGKAIAKKIYNAGAKFVKKTVGAKVVFGCSIGMAAINNQTCSLKEVVEKADSLCYQEKKKHKKLTAVK